MTDVISVVCAADDAYAMPLAVTLRSLADTMRSGSGVELFLLDGGISEQNWQRLKESLTDAPFEIHVIQPDQSTLADLRISHHISHTAYFRLLTAELLPTDISEVIYLDSDLLIRDDLTTLWELPLNGQYCAATMDIACPYIDARLGSPNFRMSSPYLAVHSPVRNYRQLGIDGRGEYFNSGVMKINLDRWRRENVADQLLQVLRDNEKHVWCWDQYALNVVCAGQWVRFSPRWNQGAHTFEYPTARHSPIGPELWNQMRTNPGIIHFTTEFKPWHYNSEHPRGELFFDCLKRTAWHDWTPERPTFSWQRWCQRHTTELVKQVTISSRKIASIWA